MSILKNPYVWGAVGTVAMLGVIANNRLNSAKEDFHTVCMAKVNNERVCSCFTKFATDNWKLIHFFPLIRHHVQPSKSTVNKDIQYAAKVCNVPLKFKYQ